MNLRFYFLLPLFFVFCLPGMLGAESAKCNPADIEADIEKFRRWGVDGMIDLVSKK